MKICEKHNSDLAGAIRKKGMWHLVERLKTSPQQQFIEWYQGTTTSETFNPLIGAIAEIGYKAEEFVGPSVKLPHLNGQHKCPLCTVEKVLKKHVSDEWVDNVSDLMLTICLSNDIKVRR